MQQASVLAAALLLLMASTGCTLKPRWEGPETDHFDGQVFYDEQEFAKTYRDLIRFVWEKPPSRWQRDLSLPAGPPPVQRVVGTELRVTFINHATVLLQVDGLNLLTDPVWSSRAGPAPLLGATRFRPPGVRFEDLPPIDAVLVSHNHYDHLDLPTLRRLQVHSAPVFFVPPGDGVWLREQGLDNVKELDWGQSAVLPNGCELHAQRSRHWSQRRVLPRDRNYSLWEAFVLQTRQGPVYFAGDTGYGPHFAATRERFGPMRLALLPIGAYAPRWLMQYQHVDPEEAVKAHQDLSAAHSVGIHWGTFELSAEGPDEPPQALAAAREKAELDTQSFVVLTHGQPRDFLPVQHGIQTRCTLEPPEET